MGYKALSTVRSGATSTVSRQATVINTTQGFAVSGSAITANTPISTEVTTPGQGSNVTPVSGGITITSVNYLNANGTISPANAVSTDGGNIKINGTGFTDPMTVIVGSTTISNANVTVANSSAMIVSLGSSAPGNANLYMFTSSNAGAILGNGIFYSGIPVWTTTSVTFQNDSAANVPLVVSGDSTLTYTLQDGSTLPTGISLISTGYLSGTATGYTTNTNSTAVIIATDQESQATQQTIAWSVIAADPQFKYVSLLLNGDTGTNYANNANNSTFLDSSTNNFTVTRAGNATQGSYTPFSQTGWSNYFDGTGDYLTVANNTALQMASGDFTIEFWIYYNSIASYQTPYSKGYTAAGDLLLQTGNGDGKMNIWISGVAVITESVAATVGVWYHYALVRSGTTVTLYRNGSSVGTTTSSVNFNTTDQLGIGATGKAPGGGSVGQYAINGYMSNLRVVKGTAVYNSSFTPPTSPLTAIANTVLLTCQSNRFIDNSTNNFTITKLGDTSVRAVSPFPPSAIYSTETNGGSIYLDGSGDYLSIADNAALELGSSNFTFEGWFNWTGATNAWTLFYKASSFELKSDASRWVWQVNAATNVFVTSWAPAQNVWYHIALVRNSATTTLYINGTSFTSGASANANDNANDVRIGSGTSAFGGYMSGVRLVIGTALYTSNFTPPTAPPTAVANTQLLLNGTNGGIVDAHSSSVWETVGNAKLSTSVTKFGNASISLDGISSRLVTIASPQWIFGTGDFTVEFWLNTSDTQGGIITPATTGAGYWALLLNGSTLYWQSAYNVTNLKSASMSGYLNNTWVHVAIVRYSGTMNFYFNGTAQGSGTADSTNYSGATNALTIGYDPQNNGYLAGYIDDLRITRGFARYTANFTPQTYQFEMQ